MYHFLGDKDEKLKFLKSVKKTMSLQPSAPLICMDIQAKGTCAFACMVIAKSNNLVINGFRMIVVHGIYTD